MEDCGNKTSPLKKPNRTWSDKNAATARPLMTVAGFPNGVNKAPQRRPLTHSPVNPTPVCPRVPTSLPSQPFHYYMRPGRNNTFHKHEIPHQLN